VSVNDATAATVLPAGTGTLSLIRPEQGTHRRLRYTFPARLLQRGRNEIVLNITRGSWLMYDAVALYALDANSMPQVELNVRPSMFYVRGHDGTLLQEATVTAWGLVGDAPARLEVRDGEQPIDDGGTPIADIQLTPTPLGTLDVPVHLPPPDRRRELVFTLRTSMQSARNTATQRPHKKWRIFVAPTVHVDIGYTGLQRDVEALHNRNTDAALEWITDFPLYHFNLESSWAAQIWLRDRPRYRHAEPFEAARAGRVGIEGGYLNLLTGLCSQEELIRNLYYSARLHRDHGIPFDSVMITDSPSHVWSLPSILAGAGARYLSVGVNGVRAPLLEGGIGRQNPFWWEGPDGGRVLTWFADRYGYAQVSRIGIRDGVDRMRSAIEAELNGWADRDDYPYDAVFFHGAYGDNLPIERSMAEHIEEYRRHYAFPEVILCPMRDFFAYIEETAPERIPTVRGDGGSWWEDGAGSSAVETGMNRRAHQDVVAAETVWSLLAATDDRSRVPEARLRRAWENILLFDEHTWGASDSVRQPDTDLTRRQWATKAGFARDASRQSRALLDEGLWKLARLAGGPRPGVLVFNPSGRERSDVVTAMVPRGHVVVDDSGNVLPQQVVAADALQEVKVAFVAPNVPAVGYRTYTLKSEPGANTAGPAWSRSDDWSIENAFYRVRFDRETGAVAGLVDKTRNVELVDATSPYRLGELIYAAGGNNPTTPARTPLPDQVTLHRPKASAFESGAGGPVFRSARTRASLKMFPHADLELRLYDHAPRVEFIYHLDKTLTYEKEAFYVAFPFAGAAPAVGYEAGGCAIHPGEDHLPGACRDWFSVQRWVTVSTQAGAVALSPVDTPLITLGGMTPGHWLKQIDAATGTVFSYALNNYWYTNYKAGQDGSFELHYVLTSASEMDPSLASRFGESIHMPLQAVALAPGAGGRTGLPAAMSLCRVEPDHVELTVFKQADDGQGYIMRLHETAGRPAEATLRVTTPGMSTIWHCDLVERRLQRLPDDPSTIHISLPPWGTACIRLE
jgi:hypothetical protein